MFKTFEFRLLHSHKYSGLETTETTQTKNVITKLPMKKKYILPRASSEINLGLSIFYVLLKKKKKNKNKYVNNFMASLLIFWWEFSASRNCLSLSLHKWFRWLHQHHICLTWEPHRSAHVPHTFNLQSPHDSCL